MASFNMHISSMVTLSLLMCFLCANLGTVSSCSMTLSGQMVRLATIYHNVWEIDKEDLVKDWGAVAKSYEHDQYYISRFDLPPEKVRRFFKHIGTIASYDSLPSCGWEMGVWDCHSHVNPETPCTVDDYDLIFWTKNIQGNKNVKENTCSITFPSTADKVDLYNNRMHDGTFEKNTFKALHGKNYTIHPGYVKAYNHRFKNNGAFNSWMELIKGSICDHIVITGYSRSASLAQIHRVDISDVTGDDRKLLKATCFGKPCKVITIAPPKPFYGENPPEFESRDTQNYLIFAEYDETPTLPGNFDARDGYRYWRHILNMTTIFVKRNLDFYYIDNSVKYKRRYIAEKIPYNADIYTWLYSDAYQARRNIIENYERLNPSCSFWLLDASAPKDWAPFSDQGWSNTVGKNWEKGGTQLERSSSNSSFLAEPGNIFLTNKVCSHVSTEGSFLLDYVDETTLEDRFWPQDETKVASFFSIPFPPAGPLSSDMNRLTTLNILYNRALPSWWLQKKD